jgi:hypothetical protein
LKESNDKNEKLKTQLIEITNSFEESKRELVKSNNSNTAIINQHLHDLEEEKSVSYF